MLRHHQVVAQIERRRVDTTSEQLQRLRKVRPVVRHRPAVRHINRHAVSTTCPAGALPVVGRQRWDVAHEDGVELADVHAKLQRRRTHERVHGVGITLEEVLEALPLLVRHHRRVLLRPQHGIAVVEHLKVVVVGILPNEFERAVAAPRRTRLVRRPPGGATPTAPAAPDAVILVEP